MGVPKPLVELPRAVCDPAGRAADLLLLAQLDDTTFIAHPGGRRRPSMCHYYANDLRVVNFPEGLGAAGAASNVVLPESLDQVNRCRQPDVSHASLKVVQAVAWCRAEIYAARVSDRPGDFSTLIDLDPFGWSDVDLNRKFVYVWRDTSGTHHVSAGPGLFTLMQHLSGAPVSATPPSQTSSD